MNKEQVLKDWIDCVEHLFNLTEEDKKDPSKIRDRAKEVSEEIKGLNSCDADWAGDQYFRWYTTQCYPKYKDKIEEITKKYPLDIIH